MISIIARFLKRNSSHVEEELIARIPELREAFERRRTTDRPFASRDWIMGQLRPLALGNIRLAKLAQAIERGEG